jgi:hypothetical protein
VGKAAAERILKYQATKDLLQELLKKRETCSVSFIYWASFSFSSGK